MGKKKVIPLKNKPVVSYQELAQVRMEIKGLIDRTVQDLGAIMDHFNRLSPPQEPSPQKKSPQEYKKFLDGKGNLS